MKDAPFDMNEVLQNAYPVKGELRADSGEHIDNLILGAMSSRQLKIARIIGEVCESTNSRHSADQVAERIFKLIEMGKVKSFGDISKWGHSEIKLNDEV